MLALIRHSPEVIRKLVWRLSLAFHAASKPSVVLPYLAITLVGISLYLPFRAKTLYHLDSVGFARSIHEFDIKAHAPHPPGFPLYVMTLRLTRFLTGANDNDSIVTVSIAATIVSGMLLYALSRRWSTSFYALQISFLFLTSPIVWFNAEVAMSYSTGMLGGLAVAWACLRLREGRVVFMYLTAVVWGLSMGFRLELGPILAPLILYSASSSFMSSKRGVYLSGFILIAVIAAWLLPVVESTNGVRDFLGILRSKGAALSPLTFLRWGEVSGFLDLLLRNFAIAAEFLIIGSLGLLPMHVIRKFRVETFSISASRNFLAAWALPGLLFHSLTTVGHSGYVLPYLPAFMLLSVSMLGMGGRSTPSPSASRILRATLTFGIILQASYFLLMPQSRSILTGRWLTDTAWRTAGFEPTLSRIQRYDRVTEHLVAEIKANYPPGRTLLIVPVGDELPGHRFVRPMFGQASYYLPDWEQRILYTRQSLYFRLRSIGPPAVAQVKNWRFTLFQTNVVGVPRRIRWLVWFCDASTQPYDFDSSWTRYPLGDGVYLIVADVEDQRYRYWGPYEFRQDLR